MEIFGNWLTFLGTTQLLLVSLTLFLCRYHRGTYKLSRRILTSRRGGFSPQSVAHYTLGKNYFNLDSAIKTTAFTVLGLAFILYLQFAFWPDRFTTQIKPFFDDLLDLKPYAIIYIIFTTLIVDAISTRQTIFF